MISTARELREIGRELNLTVSALSRADITVKKYNLTSSYGEPGRTLSKSVTLAGMRSLAGSNNQEFIKKYAGEDTKGVFQIMFTAAETQAKGLSSIEPRDVVSFGDMSGREFDPLSPLVPIYPFGSSELLYLIVVREKVYG
ncbi:MAG TPA: hypothetical protein PKW18_14180 [Candidatus Sumerlaeota bacterium]|nr:hypothetical protein [Candidatus Sumerlaeota bacterium]HPL75704.1 hypothetical protein [Candidatus Sumerlaeota bacterium]